MILYGIVILISVALIATLNALFSVPVYDFSVMYAIIAPIYGTIAVIMIDGMTAYLIRLLPQKWFGHERKFFQVSKKERNFYEKIKIRKWKDRVPDLGGFTHLHKRKVERPDDNIYLERYMLEACYGEVIHLASIVSGFLLVVIFPLRFTLLFAVPIASVNAVLNLLPTFVLRYNFYKMKILFSKNQRQNRQEKK